MYAPMLAVCVHAWMHTHIHTHAYKHTQTQIHTLSSLILKKQQQQKTKCTECKECTVCSILTTWRMSLQVLCHAWINAVFYFYSSPVCIKSLQSVDAGLAKEGEEEIKLRFLVQALKQLHDQLCPVHVSDIGIRVLVNLSLVPVQAVNTGGKILSEIS